MADLYNMILTIDARKRIEDIHGIYYFSTIMMLMPKKNCVKNGSLIFLNECRFDKEKSVKRHLAFFDM